MRSSKSRSRSKANRPRSMGNIINRVFDSSGPEGKVRGTPQQIIEKYLFLARDAQLSNDRVNAENFLQHAEHYTRMLGEAQRELAAEQEARQQGNGQQRQNGDRFERRDDRGGDFRGGEDRGDYRAYSRPDEGEGDEQPAMAAFDPIAAGDGLPVADEDAGLVETPEAETAVHIQRDRQRDRDFPRRDRERPARQAADAAPEAAAPVVSGSGDAGRPDRPPRRPRGPRKPREDGEPGSEGGSGPRETAE